MNKIIILSSLCVFITVISINTSSAQVVTDIATEVNTNLIHQDTKSILRTAKKALKAITNDRTTDAKVMKKGTNGDHFSTATAPSASKEIAKIIDDLFKRIVKVESINELKLRFEPDKIIPSFETSVRNTNDLTALGTGLLDLVAKRKADYEQISVNVGKAKDLKGSVDQNTQVLVENGVSLNEVLGATAGVINAMRGSQQRALIDERNSRQTLSYGDN
ncbi:hypothetical protein OIV19_23460 [Brucella sp. HL-2]|nr:hypothetical protein [Brucella sp. HL-2]MCV9910501.1 hypothetical protein [Brucella sp. HL-2]